LEILQVKCPKCSYEWKYKGRSRYYVTCPQCRKQFNIRYLTLRIEERERAKQLAEEKRIQKIARLEELTKTFDFSKTKKESFQNTHDDLDQITKTSGLYYFYDHNDVLLYVGKSDLLKYRILVHRHFNDCLGGKRYYRKMGEGRTEEERAILEKSFKRFVRRYRGMLHPIVIDYIFHRVKKIRTEELPKEYTELEEMRMIQELKPLSNHETACDEYYTIANIDYLEEEDVPEDVQFM